MIVKLKCYEGPDEFGVNPRFVASVQRYDAVPMNSGTIVVIGDGRELYTSENFHDVCAKLNQRGDR